MSNGSGENDDRGNGGNNRHNDVLPNVQNTTRLLENADRPIFIEAVSKDDQAGQTNLFQSGGTPKPDICQLLAGVPFLRQLALATEFKILRLQSVFIGLVERERELHSHFNFMPVFFCLGILVYFLAPAEPNLIITATTALGLCVFYLKLQTYGVVRSIVVAFAILTAGFASASFHTVSFSTKQIERQATLKVEGVVVGVSKTRRGAPRYVIRPTQIEGLSAPDFPTKIRLSTGSKKYPIAVIGQMISGKARLQPVSGPVYPGGYDFSFYKWFEGIGGSGFFYGRPQLGNITQPAGILEWLSWQASSLRLQIGDRIVKAIPNEGGDIAVALITGDRSRLDATTQESLRQSGLAHILAISGLHMALVSLTVIAVIRFIAAFFPNFVSTVPIKKWAVAAGFVAATIYLGISGASIATQRAWIMVCVMLLAVLLDRKAITMRSVAIAAIIILLIKPSSILMPGFQMSFAAVAMLVAIYEVWQTRQRKKPTELVKYEFQEGILTSKLRAGISYLAGLSSTSLIAGGATLVFSAYHFHAVASLGLISNLLAMPIISLLVMPLALLSMLLMPYGLEYLALKPMTEASLLVVELSNWVNSFGSQIITGKMTLIVFATIASGLILFASLRTRLRLLAFLPLSIGVFIGLYGNSETSKFPDVLVAENGRTIAISNDQGIAEYLYPGRAKFITGIWEKAWPEAFVATKTRIVSKAAENTCDKEYCATMLKGQRKLAIVYNPKKLQHACETSDILIAPRLWWVNCRSRMPGLILKRGDFEQYGAHALYLTNEKFTEKHSANFTSQATAHKSLSIRIERALPNTERPWNRQVTPK